MDYIFLVKHKYFKIFILAVILFLCVVLALFINFYFRMDVIYTHAFYLPIILAALWYYRKALYAAAFLSLVHIIVNYMFQGEIILSTIMRSLMFFIIAFVVGWLSEKKDEAMHALKESEQLMKDIINFLPDATFAVNLEGKIIVWNRAVEELTGIKAKDMLGKGNYEYSIPFFGERRPVMVDLLIRANSKDVEKKYHLIQKLNGGTLISEVFCPGIGKAGVFMWSKVSPLYDARGNLAGAVESVRDITERREIEEQIKTSLREKEILLREIHHRVKNNLQVVSSILRLQSHQVQSKQYAGLLRDSQNRIRAIALVHEKLYRSATLGSIDIHDYIQSLVDNLIRSGITDAGRITVELNIENLLLDIDQAMCCGLIINELVTNSIKHAFPGNREGKIQIDMFRAAGRGIELVVRDNGIGIPPEFDLRNSPSLGMQLVFDLAEHQLRGNINMSNGGSTVFTIRFKGGEDSGEKENIGGRGCQDYCEGYSKLPG